MRLIKNNTELIGIKDQNIKISLVFETDTHIEIQAKLDYPAPSCPHCHGKMMTMVWFMHNFMMRMVMMSSFSE